MEGSKVSGLKQSLQQIAERDGSIDSGLLYHGNHQSQADLAPTQQDCRPAGERHNHMQTAQRSRHSG